MKKQGTYQPIVDNTTTPPTGEKSNYEFVPNFNIEEYSNVCGNLDDIHNKMDDFIADMTKKIAAERMNIIKSRLSELGIEIDIEKEQNRRFKRFIQEFRGNDETIYYNDGSDKGLKVVTFVTTEIPFNPDKLNIGFEINYY